MNAFNVSKLVLAFIFILALSSAFSAVVFAQGDSIGIVVSTTGTVQARSAGGVLRPLARRSDIFTEDTIIIGASSVAQIRLVDSGLISFREQTEFTFDEYTTDGPGGAEDTALMTLVKGGFRTVSGTIGDDSQDEYRVDTEFASIGIRGTDYEGAIDGGRLVLAVYSGGISVTNTTGSINLGLGAGFDYAEVEEDTAPEGQEEQPDAVGQIPIVTVEEADVIIEAAEVEDAAAGVDGLAALVAEEEAGVAPVIIGLPVSGGGGVIGKSPSAPKGK